MLVKKEIDSFNIISQSVLAQGVDNKYYHGARFNLRVFWADHKSVLPVHYGVYVAEVGCKKAAASNVESVFSGAGKFTEEVPRPPLALCLPPRRIAPTPLNTARGAWQATFTGGTLLSRMVKLHYDWKYPFLRPKVESVVKRYNLKFGNVAPQAAAAEAPVAASPGAPGPSGTSGLDAAD